MYVSIFGWLMQYYVRVTSFLNGTYILPHLAKGIDWKGSEIVFEKS